MLEKEAINYLVEIGRDEKKVIEIKGQNYTHMNLNRVKEPEVSAVKLHTLEALVTFIKEEPFRTKDVPLLLHIENHQTIKLYGPIKEDRQRETFAIVTADVPTEIDYGKYYETETFNIYLQARFNHTYHKDLLLKFTGLIKEENVKQTGDDGISQKVTIKTGVTTVSEAIVPNPVRLAPWRTFQEVAQPESLFIFRMKDGPTAALFEADGGAWRLEAIKNIKGYLEEKDLPDTIILA